MFNFVSLLHQVHCVRRSLIAHGGFGSFLTGRHGELLRSFILGLTVSLCLSASAFAQLMTLGNGGGNFGGGGTLVWSATANPATQGGFVSTITWSGVSIGAASSDRIVVACFAVASGVTTNPLASVTIGGVAATNAVRSATTSASTVEVWYAVPTGTTANIVINSTVAFALGDVALTAGKLTGATATPTATSSVVYTNSPDPHTAPALTIPMSGVAVICGASANVNLTPTFNTGTFDLQANDSTTWQDILGHISASGSQTPSISGYNNADLAIASAAWGP